MRKLPPRKTEVKAVADMLSHEAEDVTALAEAVIRVLDEMRAGRDWWAVRVAHPTAGMGPFATEGQALEAARIMAPGVEDDTLRGAIYRLTTPRLLDEPTDVPPGTKCTECDHPMVTHNWPKAPVRGCIVGYKAGKPKSGCQCGR